MLSSFPSSASTWSPSPVEGGAAAKDHPETFDAVVGVEVVVAALLHVLDADAQDVAPAHGDDCLPVGADLALYPIVLADLDLVDHTATLLLHMPLSICCAPGDVKAPRRRRDQWSIGPRPATCARSLMRVYAW